MANESVGERVPRGDEMREDSYERFSRNELKQFSERIGMRREWPLDWKWQKIKRGPCVPRFLVFLIVGLVLYGLKPLPFI